MAKKKKGGNVLDAIRKKIRPEEEKESVTERTSRNRAAGDEIKSELRGILFARGRLPDPKENEGDPCGRMEMTRNALVKILEDQGTIFDDVKGIDDVLLFAARSWRTAVEQGSPQKAEWSMRALSNGIMFLRDNIPEDHEEDREKILEARVSYMQKYRTIIQAFEEIDDREAQIAEAEGVIAEKREKLKPYDEEFQRVWNTEEGKRLYGNLKAHQDGLAALSDEEKEFSRKLRAAANLDYAIFQNMARIEAARYDIERVTQVAEGLRSALTERPMVYNDDAMLRSYVVTQEELKERLASAISSARELADQRRMNQKAIEALLNGEDAQVLQLEGISYWEKVQTKDLKTSDPAADMYTKNRLREIEKLMEQSRNFEESVSEDTSMNDLPDFEVNFAEQTEDDTEAAAQLNMNVN